MLVLPEQIDSLIAGAAATVRSFSGQPIYRRHIVAALVAVCAPTDGPGLWALISRYAESTFFGDFPPLLPTKNVTVAVPPPVSLRLDLLVEIASAECGDRVLRRDIVSALALFHLPDDPTEMVDLIHELRGKRAEDARVPDKPLKRVLLLEVPPPGRRQLDLG